MLNYHRCYTITANGGDVRLGEKLLSIKEVAEWLSVSERTIFNMVERGELRGIQIGRRWRFDPADVRAYLERKQREQNEGHQQ